MRKLNFSGITLTSREAIVEQGGNFISNCLYKRFLGGKSHLFHLLCKASGDSTFLGTASQMIDSHNSNKKKEQYV